MIYVDTTICPITGYPLTNKKKEPIEKPSRADYMREYYRKNKAKLITNMLKRHHGKKAV